MRLSELSLSHFRNLGVQDLRIPEEGVALVGENAQGKSNLLEAIYYLEDVSWTSSSRSTLPATWRHSRSTGMCWGRGMPR